MGEDCHRVTRSQVDDGMHFRRRGSSNDKHSDVAQEYDDGAHAFTLPEIPQRYTTLRRAL